MAYVVLGTVLYEPLLLALRRLAQEQVYKANHHATPDNRPVSGPLSEDHSGTPARATAAVSDTGGEGPALR